MEKKSIFESVADIQAAIGPLGFEITSFNSSKATKSNPLIGFDIDGEEKPLELNICVSVKD
jgi:hypothetical protein